MTDPFAIAPMSFGLGPNITMPPPKPKSGMFANADWGNAIAAALNGYLAAGGNQAGLQGLQQLHQQRLLKQQQALQEEQYARERQDKRDDFTFEQDYKALHPTAAQPTEYERMLAAAGFQPGTPEYLKHVQNYVSMRENPVVMTAYGPMPYSSVAGPQSSPKPLTDDDILKMGGQMGSAPSGGFPY